MIRYILGAALAASAITPVMAANPQYLETFEGYSGAFTATGNVGFGASVSSITQFTSGTAQAETFGGNLATTSSAFAGSTALSWDGATDQYALVRGGVDYAGSAPLPGTAGQVYAALALRVDKLAPVIGDNDIEIFRLGQTTGNRDLHIGVFNGVLELLNRNGGPLVTLSTTAFDPASGSNWANGQWRVLAISANLTTASATSVVKVWTINSVTGAATLLGQTAPFTAVRTAGINHYGTGAFAAVPSGTSGVAISTDNWGIYNSSTVTDEAAFLRGVSIAYWGVDPQAGVADWSVYE
jgi:hypothetical protein